MNCVETILGLNCGIQNVLLFAHYAFSVQLVLGLEICLASQSVMSFHEVSVTVLRPLHDLDGPIAEPCFGLDAGKTTFLICLQCLWIAIRSTPIAFEAPYQSFHLPALENNALTPSGTRINHVLPGHCVFGDGSSESLL